MPEIFLLVLAILLIPFVPGQLIWVPLVLAVILPGTYALWRGPLFVPTLRKTMDTMISLADIKKGEQVYDLGCGDGRLVFAAASKGARATGYELSIPIFLIAKFRSFFHRNSSIQFKNFWNQNYSDADILFCYLVPSAMQSFKEKIWSQLKPGCRVISHSFRIPGVEPVREEEKVVMYVK